MGPVRSCLALAAWLALGVPAQARDAAGPETAPAATGLDARMNRHDANGNGKISKAEAALEPELIRQFDELDLDRDGSLDRAEFARFEEHPRR